ncbi:MAG: PEP-CTERM sorting domain-containing protein [Bryobacteraceae bacterium]|jgi:hypothetical protein
MAALVGMVLLASQAARATSLIEEYGSLSLWQAAVSETGVDTFDSSPWVVSTFYDSGETDPLDIGFIGGFTPSGSYLEDVGPSMSQWFNFGSGNSLASGFSSGVSQPYIQANLPASVTAVALDVMTYGNPDSVTLTFSDNTTETVSTASLAQTFVGFTFSSAVSWVKVTIPNSPTGTAVLIDNFAIGAVEGGDMDTPEPATFLLIGLGLVFLACLKRRRRTA